MEEILNWAGTCLRVVLATVFFLTPGMAFWLVVAGILVAVRRFGRSNVWQIVRKKVGVAFSLSSVR